MQQAKEGAMFEGTYRDTTKIFTDPQFLILHEIIRHLAEGDAQLL